MHRITKRAIHFGKELTRFGENAYCACSMNVALKHNPTQFLCQKQTRTPAQYSDPIY